MKKGDVGMAKRFPKKYGNKGWASTTSNPMSRWLSAPDATSLHHCLKNHHQYCAILCWIQALDTKRPIANFVKGGLLGICHNLSIHQLFQLHGFMVSHMQVLATHFSTVHNTKYLDPYLWIAGSWSSSLVSVLFREAFSHPYITFFHLLVNGFYPRSQVSRVM